MLTVQQVVMGGKNWHNKGHMANFWTQLKKPFFVLAPMEAVTDFAFREIFARFGKPAVMFTEFLNVDGLLHPKGFEKLKIDLAYSENQRPIVAQIWGRDPEKFKQAAQLIKSLGFDGVDINMGCPQDKEIASGACAALIREPKLAGEIIRATIEGASGLPVSVKTRLGYTKPEEMENWIPHLLSFDISALTLHARTKKEKSKVPARWEWVKRAVEIRNEIRKTQTEKADTLIIGNGDIKSRAEGLKRVLETGCDGVMVARGAFGNPWLFDASKPEEFLPSPKEKLEAMLAHTQLFEQQFLGLKSFETMKKNFKAYAAGFDGAHELRASLMETKTADQVRGCVEAFFKNQTLEVENRPIDK